MAAPPSLALCLEQTLGHRTHGQNLERAMADREIAAPVVRVDYEHRRWQRAPWAVSGSYDAMRQLRASPPAGVTFFHTQTVSLLAPRATRGRAYVVSVDATPMQLDTMGAFYRHRRQHAAIERTKRAVYRRVFGGASGIVAWSRWASASLTSDYGVPPERIQVRHPGAPRELFDIERPDAPMQRRPRILFVGGDFERKGGPTLLEAFRPLRQRAELMLVTDDVRAQPEPGVRIERGIRPGTARFLEVFASADIFCLPTLGDCTPVAVGEALAAGLPTVATSVGSIPETIIEGETGHLVPPDDPTALAEALRCLLDDPSRRFAMGRRARAYARDYLDASRNANEVLDGLLAIAGQGPR